MSNTLPDGTEGVDVVVQAPAAVVGVRDVRGAAVPKPGRPAGRAVPSNSVV